MEVPQGANEPPLNYLWKFVYICIVPRRNFKTDPPKKVKNHWEHVNFTNNLQINLYNFIHPIV